MKRKIYASTTSATLPIFIQDTSSSTGAGLSGLVYNTSGLVAEYRRQGSLAWTAITLATATLGTYTSGGFIADGSLAGAYEFHPPDAALASGARWVAIRLYGATNMRPVLIEIELDAVNYQSATGFVSSVPSVVGAVGSVTGSVGSVTGNVGGNVVGSVASVTGAVGSVTSGVTITTNNDKSGYSLTQSFPSNFASLGITAGGKISGVVLVDTLTTYTSNTPQTGDAYARIGAGGAGLTAIGDTRLANLDAAISTRSTYAGADTSGTTTLLGRLTSTRATNLDNLDATVSSRLATASYTAPTNADTSGVTTLLARLTSTRATNLDNLDAAVSTRLATAGYTAPASAATIAATVRDVDNTTPAAGSVGAKINAAASAGDPWATSLPGSYASGTAGNIVGNRIDAAISTRSTYAGGDTSGTTTLLGRIPGTVQPQTGDSFARLGAAGAGLTAIGDTRLANLDAAVSTVNTAIAALPTASANAAAVWSSTTRTVTDKAGYSLASSGLDSIVVEVGVNARQALSPILAASAGVLSGAGTGSITVKGGNVATTRISATTDSSGNRSVVTLSLPA